MIAVTLTFRSNAIAVVNDAACDAPKDAAVYPESDRDAVTYTTGVEAAAPAAAGGGMALPVAAVAPSCLDKAPPAPPPTPPPTAHSKSAVMM